MPGNWLAGFLGIRGATLPTYPDCTITRNWRGACLGCPERRSLTTSKASKPSRNLDHWFRSRSPDRHPEECSGFTLVTMSRLTDGDGTELATLTTLTAAATSGVIC